jgi:hypothetical protein
MIRAIVLSLVLVIGLATIVPIATEYAEAGSQRKGKKKRYQKQIKVKNEAASGVKSPPSVIQNAGGRHIAHARKNVRQ